MELNEEIDAVINELERWHKVRSRIDSKPDRNKPLVMDTLPRTIELLKKIKAQAK